MLFDWFTVGAQIINFIILVWLMKHFLYQPILNAIDTREKKIADELARAETTKNEATKEKEEYKNKNDDFELKRKELFDQAKKEANEEKAKLQVATKTEFDALRIKHQEDLNRQDQVFAEAISSRIQTEVIAIARAALRDLGGSNLEDNIVNTFISRLRALKSPEKEALSAAFKIEGTQLVVDCAIEPSPLQQDEIAKAIHEVLSNQLNVQFHVNRELVCGLELKVDGQKLGWSIDDYFTTLAKQFENTTADFKP